MDGPDVDTVTKGPLDCWVGWWKTNADGKEEPNLEGVGVGEKLGEVEETRGGEENSVWRKGRGGWEGRDTSAGERELRGTGRRVGGL